MSMSRLKRREEGPCVKIIEYHYQFESLLSANRQSGHMNYPQRVPIKILLDKASSNDIGDDIIRHIEEDLQNSSQINKEIIKTATKRKKVRSEYYKQILKSTEQPLQPKPCIFDKFCYESYSNYKYQNSRIGHRPSKSSHIIQVPKSAPKKDCKTLEIIYCENRFRDFVKTANSMTVKTKRSNERMQPIEAEKEKQQDGANNLLALQIYREALKIKGLSGQKQTVQQSLTQNPNFKIFRRKSRRTTLVNGMQQFRALQKLSLLMESERRLNEKYLSEGGDISRTVLLDVLTHRFSFLKSLSSCTRNKLYWAVFQREVTALSKISINEYLKFSEIFIGRDADPTALSSFIYLFLFGHQPPQVEKVTMIIAKLKGPSSKLKEVSERLVAIFEAILLNEIYSDENSNKTLDNLSPQIIISLIKKDELLIEWFIDLIIDK